MKQICIQCNQTAIDGNLWCQETECPIGKMHTVFTYGESFGDLEIVKLLTILRASAIYEAMRDGKPVLLKIAHNGYHDRLKRETNFLKQLKDSGIVHQMLPTLLPAHRGTDRTYGKVAHNGQTHYYSVYEHSDGDFLREYLLKNTQPWFQDAAWIAISLTEVIGIMHQHQKQHLAICPEIIQLYFDKDSVPRIKLLDLGAIAEPVNIGLQWRPQFSPPAYIAPELYSPQQRAFPSTDVYGIGLVLYEMLTGHPAFEFRLRSDDEVRRSVMREQPIAVNRSDLTTLPQIAESAINKQPSHRPKDIVDFAQKLLSTSPALPKERKERKINWQTIMIVLITLTAIAFLLITAIYLANDFG